MSKRLAFAFFALFGTATYAQVNPCVVGAWQADIGELADIVAAQMQGSAVPVSGTVIMQIAPTGALRIDVSNMTIRVKVPNAPEMDVSVSGYSAGTMRAEAGTWIAATTDYNLVGSADILGSRMEIPFTSTTGMFGNGDGTFACAGNALKFDTSTSPAKIPPNWQRRD